MATYRTTANLQLRTPSGAVGEAPDGPGGMATLADDIDAMLGVGGAERAANLAAITAIPAARTFVGKLAYAADTGYLYRYTAGSWVLWDTGTTWTNWGLVAGFTTAAGDAPPRWMIRNGTLHVQGLVNGTFPSGTYTTVTTTANVPPAAYRSVATHAGAFGQTGRFASVQLDLTGTLTVAWYNGGTTYTAPAWIAFAFAVPYGT